MALPPNSYLASLQCSDVYVLAIRTIHSGTSYFSNGNFPLQDLALEALAASERHLVLPCSGHCHGTIGTPPVVGVPLKAQPIDTKTAAKVSKGIQVGPDSCGTPRSWPPRPEAGAAAPAPQPGQQVSRTLVQIPCLRLRGRGWGWEVGGYSGHKQLVDSCLQFLQ